MGEGSLTLRLRQAEGALRRLVQPALDAEQLSFEHWQVVSALRVRPGMTMSELAQVAVLPPATVTRYVDALVSRALVLRRIDADDKRRVVVALSARGTELVDRLAAAERDAETALGDALVRDLLGQA